MKEEQKYILELGYGRTVDLSPRYNVEINRNIRAISQLLSIGVITPLVDM